MARSGYVARIREKIGNDLLMLHAVGILVFDDVGRVLLARPRGADVWITIGGGVEVDESPADAAMREFWEETGATVRIVRVLGVFGGPALRVTYQNGDAVAYTSVVFEGELVAGEPAPDGDELAELGWFAPEAIAALPMAEGLRHAVMTCIAARGKSPYFEPGSWTPPSR